MNKSRQWNYKLQMSINIMIFIAIIIVPVPYSIASEKRPYLDTNLSFEERVKDLTSRLTLKEKAILLNHKGAYVERFNIRSDQWNQCLHGVWWDKPTTMFPVSIAMAATWDEELVHEVAATISDEARAVYNLWQQQPNINAEHKGLIYRAPVINIGRNPYWGRNEEAYGEDPFLTGKIGVAYVKGLQGDHPRYLKLVSTLKHYAVNNVEQSRMSLSANVSERMLHEYWLPHFRDCIVEGNAQSIMASYNAINGAPNNINHYLLTDVLKGIWEFKGFVVSDLGGVNTMVRGHEKGKMSYEEAVAKSLIAGCDFSDREFEEYIPIAVRNGSLPIERVDDALYRVLFNRFRLGEFDPPEIVPFSNISPDIICSDQHRQLALKTAQKSIVLLKNENNILPLDKKMIKTIAVIGPHADIFTSGGYSGIADKPVKPLEGIKNRVLNGTRVLYERGCTISETGEISIDREQDFSQGQSVKLNVNDIEKYINFTVDVPTPGTYEIILRYKSFQTRGKYKLSIDEITLEKTVDMYSPSAKYNNLVSFGSIEFRTSGKKQFTFSVAGKNTNSSSYTGHFDKIILSGKTNISYEMEKLSYISGSNNSGHFTKAVEIAKQADAAIVYIGTTNDIEREGLDRKSLGLPGRQQKLVKTILDVNPNTIVVLMNAGPLTIPWIKDNAPAILEAWWAGVEGGNAIADTIFGNVNPGGKLPHTVYASESQVPSQNEYDISKGFTYMYLNGDPLYAFGHGLSYTKFEYFGLSIYPDQIPINGETNISVDIKNTGRYAGDEVVQLYVKDIKCSIVRPVKELRGFERISLEPGETKTVTFNLKASQLAFWDEVETHNFIVEPGMFNIMVGSSSADIRTKTKLEVISNSFSSN